MVDDEKKKDSNEENKTEKNEDNSSWYDAWEFWMAPEALINNDDEKE